jgi:putative transposase
MPYLHLKAESRCYFVITNSADRTPLFANPQAARIILNALLHLRSRGRLKAQAFVIMPDHLHFVASLGRKEELSRLMHSLKSYTAKEINKSLSTKGKVWQRGYYSHGIRNERDMEEKIRYIALNPMRAGLSETAEDCRFSSAGLESGGIDLW